MIAEPQELPVLHHPAPRPSSVRGDHRPHLIEQQLRRHAPEKPERRLQPSHHHRHRLPLVIPQPHQPRVAQHHHQSVTPPPRQPEVLEVHLALMPRRRLEPPNRLRRGHRPHPLDIPPHLAVAPLVARRLNLAEQPHRRQLRMARQPSLDDPLVAVQLRGHQRPRPIPDRLPVQIPVQLPRRDPTMDRAPAYAHLAGDRRLRQPLLEVMPQKHPLLSPDHRASLSEWRRVCNPRPRQPRQPPRQPPDQAPQPPPEVSHFRCPHLFHFRRTATRCAR